MISTVIRYALTTELWLPEIFVIALFGKRVSAMQVILWLKWKPHKFTACCTCYETCELICITNKRNQQLSDYYIQNTLIKANSQVKYLGVTIDEHLTFNDHIKNI